MRRQGRLHASPVLLIVVVLLLSGAACGSAGPAPVVDTPGGTVRGIDDGTVRQFLGIRYAQAPVGPLRWAMPVPVPRTEGTIAAVEPGARCPQRRTAPAAAQSEDCLFLNVTTPRDAAEGSALPVIVWWHGGGFLTGSGSDYDPHRLVVQGRVIVVTVNYRLGVLGYLGLPGLPGSGLFGFADQIQSLRWTRDNIAAFGGDPDNITVAGQSAGGIATCALLTSPALATYKIAKVGTMSAPCSLTLPTGGVSPGSPATTIFRPVDDVAAAGQQTATALGCPGPDPLECMRSQPADALVAQARGEFVSLAYGTELLPSDPATVLGDPRLPSVPVIIGGTRDEARSFVRPSQRRRPDAFSATTYPQLLSAAFGASAGTVGQQYPLGAFGDSAALAWSTVVTDGSWACPTLRNEQSLAARTPTFAYEYDQPDESVAAGVLPLGAGHTSDLDLLFDLFGGGPPPRARKELADRTIAYWTSFAADGHPRAANGPAWDPLSADAPRPLRLSTTGIPVTDTGADHRCSFWQSLR